MSESSGTLTYHEPQELGFLERLLVSRGLSYANALLFFCATISIAIPANSSPCDLVRTSRIF